MNFPQLPLKWIGIGVGALALVTTIVFSIKSYGDARYDAGQLEERVIWEKIVAEQTVALEKMQRAADQFLTSQRDADETEIENDRKELEDAIEEIPDQQTSARQRAIACRELLRRGQAPAACAADAAN